MMKALTSDQSSQLSRSRSTSHSTRRTKKLRLASKKIKKVSLTSQPQGMTIENWQSELRREFSRLQKFRLSPRPNQTGDSPNPFFQIKNLTNKNSYDLEIRGLIPHVNFCSCPDFQINTLGTCKHLEYAIRHLQKNAEYKKALPAQIPRKISEIRVQYSKQRSIIFSPGKRLDTRLENLIRKHFVLSPSSSKISKELVLKKIDDFDLSAFLTKISSMRLSLRVTDDVHHFVRQVQKRKTLSEKVHARFPEGIHSVQWQGLLKRELYPYQRKGALFAAQAGRSLLADEMGLGKTPQAIAAVEILAQVENIQRVLIVAPTSLKHQWASEIGKFSSRTTEVIEGSPSRRLSLLSNSSFFKITNYDVIRKDLDSINAWNPDLIILDEAQRIKNWKTKAAQSVKKLRSEHCIVLTGTPLENRVEELHSIVEFIDRFHFGPLFKFLSEHQSVDENGQVIGYKNLDHISTSLQGILLRRQKSEVLSQLPPRIEKTLLLPMTEPQLRIHQEYAEVVAGIVAKWKRMRFLSDIDQKRLMAALQSMRMSCNSTYLLDGKTKFQNKITELFKLLDDIFESSEDKVVVFSQWLRTHELVMEWAKRRKIQYCYFHGGLSGVMRKQTVSQFLSDPKYKIFLSTDAGGVGLNLQAANVVINMDQPWNPAVLEQRIGRSHRLGQVKPVHVFNLVSQGTIEEGMLKTLAFKKSLFTGVLDGGEKEVFLGGSRLNQFMERVEKATQSSPQTISMDTQPAQVTPTKPFYDEDTKTARGSSEKTVIPINEKENSIINPTAEAWKPLLNLGIEFLESILNSNTNSKSSVPTGLIKDFARKVKVEKDEKTGEIFLKVATPSQEKLTKFAQALRELMD